jgi:hypothetical protein
MQPRPICSTRTRNTLVSVIVAAILVGGFVWSAIGRPLLPTPDQLTQTTGPAPTPQAPRNGPRPGHEEASAPLGAPASLTSKSKAFRFKLTQPGTPGDPVAFSPCRPIHYVVRPDHAPVHGEAIISRAIAAVSTATGLTFVDDGPATEAPTPQREPYQPARYGDRWAPVLIAWATADEVPDFGVDIAGEAASQPITRANGAHVYVTGAVYLDSTKARAFEQEPRGTVIVQAILEHELGHLVGLAHVNDSTQIMFPRGSRDVLRYQAGDLTGLAELGQGSCAPDA